VGWGAPGKHLRLERRELVCLESRHSGPSSAPFPALPRSVSLRRLGFPARAQLLPLMLDIRRRQWLRRLDSPARPRRQLSWDLSNHDPAKNQQRRQRAPG